MKECLSIGTCAILLYLAASSALAQQKTVRECREEWRANRAENQTKGITERAYVTECRAGGVTAQPAPSPAAASPAPGSQKTARECREEWRSNREAYRTANITERVYVEKCRAGEAVALPAPSPAAPSPTTPAPAASPAPGSQKTARECREEWRSNREAYRTANITERVYVEKCRAGEAVALPAPPATEPQTTPAAAPANLDQFQTEGQAKVHCPDDLVVWANLNSKIYHFAGHRDYGTTEHGAYMCEKEAAAQGFRASRAEKRPGA
jgi:hypothetical protein